MLRVSVPLWVSPLCQIKVECARSPYNGLKFSSALIGVYRRLHPYLGSRLHLGMECMAYAHLRGNRQDAKGAKASAIRF